MVQRQSGRTKRPRSSVTLSRPPPSSAPALVTSCDCDGTLTTRTWVKKGFIRFVLRHPSLWSKEARAGVPCRNLHAGTEVVIVEKLLTGFPQLTFSCFSYTAQVPAWSHLPQSPICFCFCSIRVALPVIDIFALTLAFFYNQAIEI